MLLLPEVFQTLLDQRVGVLDEDRVDVARLALTRDFHSRYDRKVEPRGCAAGFLERPVPVGMRNVDDVRLVLEVLGDLQAGYTTETEVGPGEAISLEVSR